LECVDKQKSKKAKVDPWEN